jgi:hypothetical protein
MDANPPMHDTRPLFLVSSGRSGTQMLEKLLSGQPEVEAHHEYLCTHVQPLAARWAMDRMARDEALAGLAGLYGPAIEYCERPLFADSSNKLSWVIELLAELFPAARFVFTVRDGRKVASSYFHKLADECYDDRSVAILRAHLESGRPAPPPDKKYWWPIPLPPAPDAADFPGFDQFDRICWHWGAINRAVLRQLAGIEPHRQFFCRLEDLTAEPTVVRQLWQFLGLTYRPQLFELLQRPHNVNRPEDRLLTEDQNRRLFSVAGDMMAHFGYDQRKEYRMTYGQPEIADDRSL